MQFTNRQDFQPSVLPESTKTLLEPKEIEIDGFKFIISKMPCTTAQEVLVNLPQGLIPILSEFTKYEKYIFKMLSYCERVYEDKSVPLISKEIIDNNVPTFDVLYKLEFACLEHNYGFFGDGRALIFWNEVASLVKSNLSEILTDLSGKLFQAAEQLIGNLNTPTH